MNERINELAEQAEQHANEQNDKHGIRFKSEYDRKFAELIVAECAMLVWNDKDSKRILEHFGVEESEEESEEDSACPLCGEDGGTTCGMPGCQY